MRTLSLLRLFGALVASGAAAAAPETALPLAYAPAPPDNPLKDFVPYLRADPSFPHSLEWDYTGLAEVMLGPESFDWTVFDRKLDGAAGRGHQFVARFYLEYPGRATAIPRFLLDGGLQVHEWARPANGGLAGK